MRSPELNCCPRLVAREGRKDGDGTRRQSAQALEQGRVRPVLPHHELHPADERSHIPHGGGKHDGVVGRRASDEDDSLRIGLKGARHLERRGERQEMVSSRHVRRQGREVDHRLEREAVHDGDAREASAHPLGGELQGPRSLRQDGVEAEPAILLDDVVDELLPALILGKAIEIQKLIVEHDARGRLGSNDRVQRVGESHNSRRVGIMAVEHQHALRRGRVLGPGDTGRSQSDEDDRDRQQRASEGTSREQALHHHRRVGECAVNTNPDIMKSRLQVHRSLRMSDLRICRCVRK